MQDGPSIAQLVTIMNKRTSGRNSNEVLITPEFFNEIRETLLPTIPSGGGFRTVDIMLNNDNHIEVYSKSISKVAKKYGETLARKLIDIEGGVLAAHINLYVLVLGYQLRYLNNTKDDLNDERYVLELMLLDGEEL